MDTNKQTEKTTSLSNTLTYTTVKSMLIIKTYGSEIFKKALTALNSGGLFYNNF
jgi:hypothetical protein